MNTQAPTDRQHTLASPLPPAEAMGTLLKLSRKGKLAGFEQLDDSTFRLQVFGNPYDHEMIGRVSPADAGSRVECTTRLLRKLPTIMIVVFALATWPGVVLTESMLNAYFPNTLIANYTWWWYIPLMLISVPALWKQFTKSQTAAREHEQEVLERLRAVLNAS